MQNFLHIPLLGQLFKVLCESNAFLTIFLLGYKMSPVSSGRRQRKLYVSETAA